MGQRVLTQIGVAALAGSMVLIVAGLPSTSLATSITTDIAIELPRNKGKACADPGAGIADLYDGVPDPPHGVTRGAHTTLPPDFTTPLLLPYPLPTNDNVGVSGDPAKDTTLYWLQQFGIIRAALAASEQLFWRTSLGLPVPAEHCTFLVEVTVKPSIYTHDLHPIPSANIGLPGACPVAGPPSPTDPTICIPLETWPTGESRLNLVKKRMSLYAQAHEILALAERQLDDQLSGTTTAPRRPAHGHRHHVNLRRRDP